MEAMLRVLWLEVSAVKGHVLHRFARLPLPGYNFRSVIVEFDIHSATLTKGCVAETCESLLHCATELTQSFEA